MKDFELIGDVPYHAPKIVESQEVIGDGRALDGPPPPPASSPRFLPLNLVDLLRRFVLVRLLDKIGPNLGAAPVTVPLSLSHIRISELEERDGEVNCVSKAEYLMQSPVTRFS